MICYINNCDVIHNESDDAYDFFLIAASEEIPFVPHVLRNVSDLSSILLGVGTVHYTPNGAPPIDPHTVLVGMGITSNKVNNLTSSNLQQKIPFFTILMPSFCKTCSRHFKYHFSIAYDFNDPKFSEAAFREAFTTQFRKITSEKCPTESTYDLIFVECPHHKRPAWAQNDAMIAGYMRNMAYYYRINDDTVMVTPGWTEAFIQGLAAMDPPNVGVVGPHHSGGNTAILTYDFVSFKHVEIFGFYYPRAFEDWHGDRWITDVYKPGRTHKLEKILLNHAMSLGQRYSRHYHNADQVKSQVAKDKTTLVRWVCICVHIIQLISCISAFLPFCQFASMFLMRSDHLNVYSWYFSIDQFSMLHVLDW